MLKLHACEVASTGKFNIGLLASLGKEAKDDTSYNRIYANQTSRLRTVAT